MFSAMALACWMVLISIPFISSAAIGQASTKKDASTMAINFQSNTVYKKKSTTMVRCFCNLPECGEQMRCFTNKGCFSELQPMSPEEDYQVVNDAYGCLDMLSVTKTCDQILKSMEAEDSEIPILKHATDRNDVVRAYHCCQDDMCNDQSRMAASERTIQEALATMIRISVSQVKEEQSVATATSSGPSSTSHPDAANNAINNTEIVQAVVVPDNSTTFIKPIIADLPTSVAPFTTDLPATGNVTTTAELVGDQNATSAPVTAGSGDYNTKNTSDDVAVVSHDNIVAMSTSTEHIPSTSAVSTDTVNANSTTEVPVAVTTVGSSGNETDATTITTFGSSGNVTEATQSTTTVATTVADGSATGNDLTKNLTSETTVIAETSPTEIATTTKGSAEQETPIAVASNAVHVALTDDKAYAKLNETSPTDSAVAPQLGGVKLENATHVFAAKDGVTDDDSVNQDHSRVESSALINQISGPLPVGARNNWSFLYLFLDFSGVYAFVSVCIAVVLIVAMVIVLRKANIFKKSKGVYITPGKSSPSGKTSVEIAAKASKSTGKCVGCVGASKYAYIAVPELTPGTVRR